MGRYYDSALQLVLSTSFEAVVVFRQQLIDDYKCFVGLPCPCKALNILRRQRRSVKSFFSEIHFEQIFSKRPIFRILVKKIFARIVQAGRS